jgi:hypothetical protein
MKALFVFNSLSSAIVESTFAMQTMRQMKGIRQAVAHAKVLRDHWEPKIPQIPTSMIIERDPLKFIVIKQIR